MTIKFTGNNRNKIRADFGSATGFGDVSDNSSGSLVGENSSYTASPDDNNSDLSTGSSTSTVTATSSPTTAQSLANGVVNSASGGACGGSSLCGAANSDAAAQAAKKQELAKKYPTKDCGPTPTAECLAYNASMVASQNAEYTAWSAAQTAAQAKALPASDATKMAAVASLAAGVKAIHPEAGAMTLSQIYKAYPDDFDRVYAAIQTQYPFLQGIDPQTALAMSPNIANMTLDQLIAKTTTLGGNSLVPVTTGSSSFGTVALLGAAAAGILALIKLRR